MTDRLEEKGTVPLEEGDCPLFLFWSSPDESGRYNCETSFATPVEEKFDFLDYLWYIWMRKNLSGDLRFL